MKLRYETRFIEESLKQELPVRKGIGKAIRIAEQLGLGELLNHEGVHLEKLKDQVDQVTGLPLYSLRATQAARIKAMVDEEVLVFLTIEPDHGKAYH
jgi:NADH:ubiquinone oxidoreductase subunit F (NADH-binding)